MYQSPKSSYSGEKQANKKPILVQMQSFDSRIWSFWLVVWPHNGSTRRIEMSGAEKSRLEIIPSTYHCYIQGRNPPRFRCEKPGLELHYTPIQAPVSALIGTARSKLIILSSKFEISTKSWVKLSLHWPFWANSFKIFIFNVPKQQKCTFEGHDLVMPWGVRGFQAFISSPLMIFWSKKSIWWVLRPMFLLLNSLQKTA